ncbi:hypothetical protein [Microvirga arabica]|uniref:DUF3606 domain-containing protein n=1 Tax=Microvirga arabica TaxID=1128671 RepID=A0ABV6Y4H8_9HYPH|nr:hypothetical protein [Microvirga arabica]MBM1174748.1 hypothetical protein [Microvirga arabica]
MPTPKKKPSSVRTSLRIEPPTLEEAIYAAQGLTDNIDDQVEIAARLMGLSEVDVRAAILKVAITKPRISIRPPAQARFAAGRQPVVVERRASRILIR